MFDNNYSIGFGFGGFLTGFENGLGDLFRGRVEFNLIGRPRGRLGLVGFSGFCFMPLPVKEWPKFFLFQVRIFAKDQRWQLRLLPLQKLLNAESLNDGILANEIGIRSFLPILFNCWQMLLKADKDSGPALEVCHGLRKGLDVIW